MKLVRQSNEFAECARARKGNSIRSNDQSIGRSESVRLVAGDAEAHYKIVVSKT